jgi:hypothetical protein
MSACGFSAGMKTHAREILNGGARRGREQNHVQEPAERKAPEKAMAGIPLFPPIALPPLKRMLLKRIPLKKMFL